MKLNPHARNFAIIALIAAVIVVIPGGGSAGSFIVQFISLVFLAAIAWVASRLYREHRVSLYSLGDRKRLILYVAAGVATLTFTASGRLLNTGLGSIAWILLLAACAYAVFWVFRSSREY
ncbi:MAG TPA: hypothetical protein VGI55_15330 [Solirubrobacteraceae bacterium]